MTRLQTLLTPFILFVLSLGCFVNCSAQTQPPQLFFSDLDSAPNAGGESVSGFAGAYVTLYGNFLGTTQGTSTITWNGQNCLRVLPATGSYSGWGSVYFWYQRIVVQLGSGCTPGTGNFVVTVNGTASNGIPFTVRSGNIYFVSTSGNDSNSGTAASPFKTIPHCKNALKPGDTCYIENGVTANTADNYDSTLEIESGGTAGNPIALAAYPGATVTLGSSSTTYALRVPNIGVDVGYVTLAGLNFAVSSETDAAANASTWRVVANNFQCPTADGEDGCFTTHELSGIKFFGNEATNIGVVSASKQQHAVYFSSDTNHVEAAWNYVHNNRSCRAIQFHSSPLNGGGSSDPTGHNQFDLSVHDNLIHDDPCDGINFATVDPSQGKVEAYNNVIYHVGIGPSPQDGDSGDYSCIYMAYITNTGPVGGGTVEIYNNTLYDCGPFVASFANNGNFMINGGETSLKVRIRNNILYQINNEPFGNGSGWNSTYASGSNNVMYSTGGASLPNFITGTVTSDPKFVNLTADNFHLQQGSPAQDAGLTISSSNTYNNYVAWNGLPRDRDGVSRPQGSSFDIGAYEYFTGSGQPPSSPTLQSIAVTPSPATVGAGSTVALTATGSYSDGSTKNLTSQVSWTSSNSSIATVSASGVATGVSAGTAVIQALLSGVAGSTSLTVTTQPAPTLQSITVTPNPATVNVGSTVAFTATGNYSDGSTQNLTASAAWTSSNTLLATISAGGAATGIAGGNLTISATASGVTGTASLTVQSRKHSVTLQSIAVAPNPATVNAGNTMAFSATGHYSDGSTQNLTSSAAWSSSNTVLATINASGVATGIASGTLTISATASGVTGTTSLTVTAPPPVTLQSITVSPSPATVNIGSTVAFSATGHYSDGTTKNLTANVAWSSSNTALATINASGVATGIASGTLTISATTSGVTGTTSLTVIPSSVVVVNFDSPAPSGSPYSPINGIFGGINFGANQWSWEPAYLSDPTNNIYFSSSTGNSRSFSFASGTHVLISMKVATSLAGTLTITDNTGQTKTQNVATGAMQLVATGWKNPSSTVTVSFTAGWNIEFDDITYQ